MDRLSIEEFPTVKAIAERWQSEQIKLEEFAGSLKEKELKARIEYACQRTMPRSRTLWHILLHIVTHGVHHRAEAGQHMDSIGYSSGDLDFIIYCSKMGL